MDFDFVYKICNKPEWLIAKQNNKFIGTKKDITDGFIHFSKKNQISRTLKKYFSKQKNLILLKIEVSKIEDLVWEQSSDGNIFPHLYSTFDISSVCNEYDIFLNSNGIHSLPSEY